MPQQFRDKSIRTRIIPASDLDLQGDTGEPLALYDGIKPVLAVLSAQSEHGPVLVEADDDGSLAAAIISALPAGANNIGSVNVDNIVAVLIQGIPSVQLSQLPNLGSQGNLWNAAVVAALGKSAAVAIPGYGDIIIVGSTSAATTISVEWSMDGATYYTETALNVALAGAGTFVIHAKGGAQVVRIASLLAATITASVGAAV